MDAETSTQGEATAAVYGVTLEDIQALAPYVTVSASTPTQGDPYQDVNGRTVTPEEATGFIASVASRVAGHVLAASRIPETHPFWVFLRTAAADAVKNGAASYLVAAASPESASQVESQSYAAVLWARFEDALADIDRAIKRAGDDVDDAAAAGTPHGSFPAPLFADERRY